MTIYEIRRRNLRNILQREYNGKPKALADIMGKDGSQIARYIKPRGGKPENIGNSMARQIETALRKPEGWLDRVHELNHEVREAAGDYRHTLTHEQMEDVAEEKAFQYVDEWETMHGEKLALHTKRQLFRAMKRYFLRKLMAGRTIPQTDDEIKQEVEDIGNIIEITSKTKGAG